MNCVVLVLERYSTQIYTSVMNWCRSVAPDDRCGAVAVLIAAVLGIAQPTAFAQDGGRFDRPAADYLHPGNRPVTEYDRFCGAYVIWHLLRLRGDDAGIATIIDELGIRDEGWASLGEIANAINARGVSAIPARIDPRDAADLQRPFVAYLKPDEPSAIPFETADAEDAADDQGETPIGHFVLCVPLGNGLVEVFNGSYRPYVFPVSNLEIEAPGDRRWDGVVVLSGSDVPDSAGRAEWLAFGVGVFSAVFISGVRWRMLAAKRSSRSGAGSPAVVASIASERT